MSTINIAANSALNIANYFIQKATDEGAEITPMKVLKLTYIANGWYLALDEEGDPLIREKTYAWKYGPVITEVYETFKRYGRNDIKSLAFNIFGKKEEYDELLNNKELREFLDEIWDIYKGLSGIQLSNLTHQPGTPWDITWNKNKGSKFRGAIIPNELIKKYYKEKIVD